MAAFSSIAMAIAAAAAVASAANSYKQGQAQQAAQKKAQQQAQESANQQAKIAQQQADEVAKQTSLLDKQSKSTQRNPDTAGILSAASQAGKAGASGTMLTGPLGVDPNALSLGKNTLLGQ